MKANLITAFGESKTIKEWVVDSRCVVDYDTLRGRLKKKQNPELSITTPNKKSGTADVKVGDFIHRLEILDKYMKQHYGQNATFVKVRCTCAKHTEFEVKLSAVLEGNTRSCGCLKSEIQRELAIERNYKHGQSINNNPIYDKWCYVKYEVKKCEYEPWNDFTNFEKWSNQNGYQLGYHIYLIDKKGLYEPSNCIWHKKGYSDERLHQTWRDVITRCENNDFKQYHNYGGRGITICSEWRNSYFTFKKWALNNGYTDELTIERKNVNGNYEPSNCTWITISEQGKNRTNTLNNRDGG